MQKFANQQWKMTGVELPPELIEAESPEAEVNVAIVEAAAAIVQPT
jgi:hypothetical protein